MTRKQLEKIRKQYEELDFSRWHILGYDELLKINGGSSASSDDDDEGEEAESITEEESGETDEAVANAKPGDTIKRDDGTEYTLNAGDIKAAQDKLAAEERASGGNKADSKETNSSKESGNAKDTNAGKENSTTKENASSSKKSDSPDLVERARQSDEELSARKNSELNTPKGTNSFKSAINSVKEVFDNVKNDPGTLSGFTGELAKSASKVGGKTNLSALSPTAPLMNYSEKLSTFGRAIALVDIVQNGQKERQDVIDGKQSVAHAIYNTVTHGVSVGAGFGFGASVTTAATASTVGIGSIPGITAGIIAGSSVSTGCEKLFDIIEDKIW